MAERTHEPQGDVVTKDPSKGARDLEQGSDVGPASIHDVRCSRQARP